MWPESLSARASAESSNALITTGGQVNPRDFVMNPVLVPLPAPGAPPRRMISLGNRRFSRPKSASRSCQTESKMRCASLISKSLSFPATGGVIAGEIVAGVGMGSVNHDGLNDFSGKFDKRNTGRGSNRHGFFAEDALICVIRGGGNLRRSRRGKPTGPLI